jgi:hypothetical protein
LTIFLTIYLFFTIAAWTIGSNAIRNAAEKIEMAWSSKSLPSFGLQGVG